MEDLSKDGEHVPEILSLTEQLYEKLKNAENQTLTRKQVIAHLGEFSTHYYHVVTALERIKKVSKKQGQTGGIELRTAPGLQHEILPGHRRKLHKYFSQFLPDPPAGKPVAGAVGNENRSKTICRLAIETLEGCPEGLRYMELFSRLRDALPPKFNSNHIHAVMCALVKKAPESVYKPAKGVFRLTKYRDGRVATAPPTEIGTTSPRTPIAKGTGEPQGKNLKEHDFYQPFADWLVNTLQECTQAEPVGGNILGKKWGTPDVIGVRKQEPGAFIDLPTEIVSAEIKIDTYSLITAFGQACAYRLFSHKSYIVVPENSPEDDIARLDTLSRIFGIGLITFNPQNPNDPKFGIRARAAKHDPDMLYVNECMKSLWEAKIKLH